MATIDSFDHKTYERDAQPLYPYTERFRRFVLFGNYFPGNRNSQDKMKQGQGRRSMFRAYGSLEYEPYQHLLLGKSPIVDDSFEGQSPIQHSGYDIRRQRALDRYKGWQSLITPRFSDGKRCQEPIEVILKRTDIRVSSGRQSRLKSMCPVYGGGGRRFAIDISASATTPLCYRGTLRRRYLYVPFGTRASSEPPVYDETFLETVGHAWQDEEEGVDADEYVYAVGCTCRDFLFNAATDQDGNSGRAAYGCKHMIFFNLCSKRRKIYGMWLGNGNAAWGMGHGHGDGSCGMAYVACGFRLLPFRA